MTAELNRCQAAVDRQGDAGDKIGLVGGKEQGGVGDIPAGAHPAAQRHPGIALGSDPGRDEGAP